MSCNGCRVLRKGCSEACILRPCLQWMETPEAQAHATLFVAKFFGRADLMSFISAVPNHQRPALFQSLLYEACGRTVNPVNGAVGLLTSGNWHICQAAVDTVQRGGVLHPIPPELLARAITSAPPSPPLRGQMMAPFQPSDLGGAQTTSLGSEMSGTTTSFDDSAEDDGVALGGQNRKLLNLFV